MPATQWNSIIVIIALTVPVQTYQGRLVCICGGGWVGGDWGGVQRRQTDSFLYNNQERSLIFTVSPF